jgi:hypothetical protein
MTNDLAKQLQGINKQLSQVQPVVQVATYLGVSPLVAVIAAASALIVSLLLIFNVGTGLI